MPRYEFLCEKCQKPFELTMTISEHEKGKVRCPECKSMRVAAQLSGFMAEVERLSNVTLAHDDLFDSRLESHAFDLVHSRFEIGPLGRAADQLASYLRLVAPGGWVILEDPDLGSCVLQPSRPGCRTAHRAFR